MIVGLGNPGSRYRSTRHNIGFLVLDVLAAHQGIIWKDHRHSASLGKGTIGRHQVVLVKPQSFMNNSGEAVSSLVRSRAFAGAPMLVVHDDLDLPFGRIKIIKGGGSGGHKGVASIQTEIGEQDFPRVKMGIGRPVSLQTPEEYVLERFSVLQEQTLGEFLDRGSAAVITIVEEGLEAAMNQFNRREDSEAAPSKQENSG